MKSGGVIQYTQHYSSGIEYRQGAAGAPVIEAIYHPEGRVFYTSATASRYEYSIRDHASASLSTGLGNTRITLRLRSAHAFSDLNGTCPERSRRDNKVDVSSSATTNEVLQENHYYPFGLGTNGAWMNNAALDNLYQYNGKELNNDWGLGLYEYGARNYDPAVCRFTGVDPIAGQFAWVTTYNYAENEPIANIDLWGLQQYYAADGRLLGQIGQNTQARLVSNESDVETVIKYVQWANTARNETDQAYNTGVCDERSCDTGMSGEELNLRSTLSTLKQAEAGSANPPLDYNDWNKGDKFTQDSYEENPDAYANHPGANNENGGGTAAGAYQFLKRYYNEGSFSPENQDKAAVKNMTSSGYQAAQSGSMENVKSTLGGRWISLKEWSSGSLQKVFNQYRANELNGKTNIAVKPGETLKIR